MTKVPTKTNKEHAVIAEMIALRVKSMQFANGKEITVFRKDLLTRIDKVFDDQRDAWSHAKEKSKRAKIQRELVQGEVCARWATSQLQPGDFVAFRGVQMKYQVVSLGPDSTVECSPAKLVTTQGDMTWVVRASNISFGLTTLQKIYHEGKWLDIYALASGM